MVSSVTKIHVIIAAKLLVTLTVTVSVQKVTFTRTRNALTLMNAKLPMEIHRARITPLVLTLMGRSSVAATLVSFTSPLLIFASTLTNVQLEHTNATKMQTAATIQEDTTALARKVSRVTVSTVSILMSVNSTYAV